MRKSADGGDCYKSPINFSTEEKAETFIKEVLCSCIKTNATQRNIIKEIECK